MSDWKRFAFLLGIILAAVALYYSIPSDMLAAEPKMALTLILVAIYLWATQLIPNGYTSILLLMLFAVFSLAPLDVIFSFWINPIAYLVISSFLIARAVEKSGLSFRLGAYLFAPVVRSYSTFVMAVYGAGIILSLFIPHPFSRAFIMLAIVKSLFEHLELDKRETISIGLAVFVGSALNSFVFLTGDAVLNVAVARLAGTTLSWLEWFIYMGIPSLALNALVVVVHLLLFPDRRKKRIQSSGHEINRQAGALSTMEKQTIFWLFLAVVLWSTDYWHGVHPGWVGVIISVGMALPKVGNILKGEDFHSIHIDILLFITAALAIGGVGAHTGLNQFLAELLFPEAAISNPFLFALLITGIGMVMHFFVGSSFALISVMVPITTIYVTELGINPLAAAMIIYLCSKAQWIFPFHVMDLMIGIGEKNGYYTQQHVIRFGVAMIIPLIVAVLLFYVPWWLLLEQFYTG